LLAPRSLPRRSTGEGGSEAATEFVVRE